MRGLMFGVACLTVFGVLHGISAGDGAMAGEKFAGGVSLMIILGAVWLISTFIKKITNKDR